MIYMIPFCMDCYMACMMAQVCKTLTIYVQSCLLPAAAGTWPNFEPGVNKISQVSAPEPPPEIKEVCVCVFCVCMCCSYLRPLSQV